MFLEIAPHRSHYVPQVLHRALMSSSLSVARTLHLSSDIFRESPMNGVRVNFVGNQGRPAVWAGQAAGVWL
jgi:hypothetical protein